RGFDIDAQRGTDAGVDRLLDRRIAVSHQRLDIAGNGDGATGVLDQLPLGVVERAAADVGGVRCQRLFRVQFLQQAGSAALPDADVDGDARADVTRSLERWQNLLGRAGRRR